MKPELHKVVRCAGCGGTHLALLFKKFILPPPDATHFASCPRNRQPILMRITETQKPT